MNRQQASSYNPLPSQLELIVEYNAIVIRRTWKSPLAYFLTVFSLFWNGFMVVWMSLAISQGVWIMAAFGSLHAAVGLYLAYYTLALFINKTDIRIDTYDLSVKHYPLRWPGALQIPVEDVQQVYCKERIVRTKNSSRIIYDVLCIDRANKQKKLLSGLADASQAQFIEAEIEKILGIKNRPVTGEC